MKKNELLKHERLGETRVMLNGMEASIIEYNSASDVTVRFSDGFLRRHVTYNSFVRGSIRNPNVYSVCHSKGQKSCLEKRLGEMRMMSCGIYATIINYKNCNNIDVRFEDGVVVYNTKYTLFKTGKIKHPVLGKINVKHLGETRRMRNGKMATIIRYRGYNDIDVQFEDGFIAEKKQYSAFKRGLISDSKYY